MGSHMGRSILPTSHPWERMPEFPVAAMFGTHAIMCSRNVKYGLKNIARNNLKQQLIYLLENQEIRTFLLDNIRLLLLDENTKEACQLLIKNLTDDPETKKLLQTFLKDVISSDTVTSQAISLGKDVTRSVIDDENVQKQTGNALWNATIHAITPRWFS